MFWRCYDEGHPEPGCINFVNFTIFSKLEFPTAWAANLSVHQGMCTRAALVL